MFRLFVRTFTFHSRIFHSSGDVTIATNLANFDLCSVLMAIEQREFFSMPHYLRQGTSVYNGHLRGPVTLIPMPSIWQSSCHKLFLVCFYLSLLRSVAAGIRTHNLLLAGKRSKPLRHRRGGKGILSRNKNIVKRSEKVKTKPKVNNRCSPSRCYIIDRREKKKKSKRSEIGKR